MWAWSGGSWVGTLKFDCIVVVGLKTNAEEWWVRENILDTEAVTCPLKETTVGLASVQHVLGTPGKPARERGVSMTVLGGLQRTGTVKLEPKAKPWLCMGQEELGRSGQNLCGPCSPLSL